MLYLFEGEIIYHEKLFYEINYDFLEMKGIDSLFIIKQDQYRIPCSVNQKNNTNLLIFSFYKIINSEKQGILEYQEMNNYNCKSCVCVKKITAIVEKPIYYHEFIKNRQKYLLIKTNSFEKFELHANNGELVKEKAFYRVLGNGPYIFKAKDIIYTFGHSDN